MNTVALATPRRRVMTVLAATLATLALAATPAAAAKWGQVSGGISESAHVVAIRATADGSLIVTTEKGGIHRRDRGESIWVPLRDGLPVLIGERIMSFPANITVIAPHSRDAGRLLLGTSFAGVMRQDGDPRTFESANVGLFGQGEGDLSQLISVSDLAYAGRGSNRAYAALPGRGVYFTIDDGRIWRQAESQPASVDLLALATHPQRRQTLAVSTSEGVFVSRDAARSWTLANRGLGSRLANVLAFDPRRGRTLLAGTPSGVFRSTNGGRSWKLARGPIRGAYVRDLAADPRRAGVFYAGTAAGVFVSRDHGRSWKRINRGLSTNLVWAIAIVGKRLYAGTLGGGVQVRAIR